MRQSYNVYMDINPVPNERDYYQQDEDQLERNEIRDRFGDGEPYDSPCISKRCWFCGWPNATMLSECDFCGDDISYQREST